ncbi:hypothetical protein [Streptacidiphilus rugosus]|nr:hypothetical protein [Streptacidiphilus rugosus]
MRRPYVLRRPVLLLVCFAPLLLALLAALAIILFVPFGGVGQG